MPPSPLVALAALAACSPQPGEAPPAAAPGLPGASAAPPELTLPPGRSGRWELAGGELRLEPGGRLSYAGAAQERLLGSEVVGLPAVAAGRVVYAERLHGGPETALVAWEPGQEPRVLVQGTGSPDRPALSPDGSLVVFAWAPRGIVGLWALPFEGGEPAALTPCEPVPGGGPPPGWLPPPHRGAPRLSPAGGGWRVDWEAPDGSHALLLDPEGLRAREVQP